ncbi:dynactin p62 family-domain-containing protein [Cokeromyces recurvatus]|uniref:dynactin p62 family-domain-containing protein n=1 Tax=Cokeromyces recurvatus TaxID=90255 RepID=UPI0022202C8E|nr:dynactin p62 family-domain-containing protein [Cokeromyces recurvatus]KAI7905113.1 dynactin p62 family-domain-containing protein [Cokeromyces recurvatus]
MIAVDENESIPFVEYYCDCSAKKENYLSILSTTENALTNENVASLTGLHLLSKQASNYIYPLSRLYFCEDCHQIRCPSCVQDEIVSYYCPNCLFEVPTASVKSEKNRCARNCFQCPICQNTLSVVAAQEPTQISSIGSGQGPYFLACNVCRWNSQEINMTFEKPTSLALQLQKNEEALADTKEFDQLKEHFEKNLRVNSSPSLPTSFLTFSSSTAFSKYMGSHFHHDTHMQQGKLDDISEYEPSVQIADDDIKLLESITTMRSIDGVSTLSQRFSQLHNQPYELSKIHPQRIHLAIKRSKRCRSCRHILIKPEQKAQATRFKIKLVAMNYIPTITLVKLPKKNWHLKVGVPTQLILKFTNPLYEEMNITLATPQIKEINGKVTILSPHFTVGAYNETIEYDDEMYPMGNNSNKRNNNNNNYAAYSYVDGIYEKKNNYTSILIEVVPEETGEFKFPLLVTYNYKSDEDRMDVSSGDIDADEMDEMDMDDSVDGSKKSSLRFDDDKIKSYSFWCLIGIGFAT